MDLDIQYTKIKLIQWLTTLDDTSIIQKILMIQKEETINWSDDLSETERKSIKKGIQDAEKGNLEPHSEARKIYGKWL